MFGSHKKGGLILDAVVIVCSCLIQPQRGCVLSSDLLQQTLQLHHLRPGGF
jgi:hypothetical protein